MLYSRIDCRRYKWVIIQAAAYYNCSNSVIFLKMMAQVRVGSRCVRQPRLGLVEFLVIDFMTLKLKPLLALAGLLLPLVTGLTGCREKSAATAALTEVEVVAIEQKDVPIFREWVGTLDGDVNATISAQVAGYLVARDYSEGGTVTNGQVLFRIDPASFATALAKARAQLAQAQASKGQTRLDVERFTILAKTEAISRKELDDAVQADLSADAQVDGAAAAVKQAELNLDFTTIRSPVAGVAGLAKAQIGDLVGPSSGPLTTVSTISPIRVNFSVSEQTYYRAMEKRQAGNDHPHSLALQLVLASGDVFPEAGSVRFSDNRVDVKTGTLSLVGEFPNASKLLAPGMFARVRAEVGMETNAMLVPQRAVMEIQGRYLVAVVGAGDKVSIKPVNAGERVGSAWIIQGRDLHAGDRVVVEGLQKVRDGMTVKPSPFGTAAGAAKP